MIVIFKASLLCSILLRHITFVRVYRDNIGCIKIDISFAFLLMIPLFNVFRLYNTFTSMSLTSEICKSYCIWVVDSSNYYWCGCILYLCLFFIAPKRSTMKKNKIKSLSILKFISYHFLWMKYRIDIKLC